MGDSLRLAERALSVSANGLKHLPTTVCKREPKLMGGARVPRNALQLGMRMGDSFAQRFWAGVTFGDGCWMWRSGTRYGYFSVRKGLVVLAHRMAWELAVGPIPEGMLVLHHCDTPRCCRPDHLFIGTPQDNAVDMHSKGRWKRHKKAA